MDAVSIAASLVSAQAAQSKTMLAARLMKMNADQDGAVAALLQSAGENANAVGKAQTPGAGTVLDITV